MSWSPLLQRCPLCLFRLTCIVSVMGSRTTATLSGVASRTSSVLRAAFLCNCCQAIFSVRLVSVHVVHPYTSIDTTAAWEKLRFILSVRTDSHMTGSLSIAVDAFAGHVLMRHRFLGR